MILHRLRAWLEIGRVSNLPTVVTNALAGAAAGSLVHAAFPWSNAGMAIAIASCCYLAGMVLNDAFDAKIDAEERPNRPIPSGRISKITAMAIGFALLAAALAIASILSAQSLLYTVILAICIVAYNLLHARGAWTIALLGVCRGLVYMLAAGAPICVHNLWHEAAPLAGAAILYTVGLSWIAREEVTELGARRAWLGWALPLPAMLAPVLLGAHAKAFALTLSVLFALWTWRAIPMAAAGRTGPAVMRWLAGFCLMDATFLAMLGRTEAAWIAIACFALTAFFHRKIAGS